MLRHPSTRRSRIWPLATRPTTSACCGQRSKPWDWAPSARGMPLLRSSPESGIESQATSGPYSAATRIAPPHPPRAAHARSLRSSPPCQGKTCCTAVYPPASDSTGDASRRGLTSVDTGTSLRDVMTRRTLRIVMALLSLTAFGAGLVSVCLPDDVHSAAYYDGDDDDVGVVQERQTLASHVGIVQPVVHLAPPLLFHREVVQRVNSAGYLVAPRRSESRAPPA